MGRYQSMVLAQDYETCSTTSSRVYVPSLSRGDQLAKPCGDDVHATAESAHRKFAGRYEAVCGGATDAQ